VEKDCQGDQGIPLQGNEMSVTGQSWKGRLEQGLYDALIETLQVLEVRAMKQDQDRHDFAEAQARVWTAIALTFSQEICLPLREEHLTKVIHFTKYFNESVHYLSGALSCGSA
jgi:hypothetical protein